MTGGTERRDESVSFSLKELMKLEDERIDQEKTSREARERSAKLASDEAERRAKADLAARARAEADERERTRRIEREEEARLEAMQRATVEQARITVEARTRAEESERERSHERELQRMRLEGQKKPEIGALIGSGLAGTAFALAGFMVFFFAAAKPASDHRIAELDGHLSAAEDRGRALDRRLDDQNIKLAAVTKELEAARKLVAAQPAPALVGPTTTTGRPPVGHPPTPPRIPVKEEKCADPHDPLCFHIP